MDIQSRVVNYYKSNQFIQKYLKGIDSKTNELVLNFNNEDRRISIDMLESVKTEDELVSVLNGNSVNVETPIPTPVVAEPAIEVPVTPSVEVPVVDAQVVEPEPREQVMLTEANNMVEESLNDIKILVELKNKDGLNNLLKKFAVNPSTGLIDINQAISVVTQYTMSEVVKSIKNKYEFDTDLTKFDIDGTYKGAPITGNSSTDEKIMNSFNNIKLFIEASKMFPEQVNYNDDQINNFMKTYMDKVKAELGSNNGGNQEIPAVPAPMVNDGISNEVPANASAGFADIFVLTVIVLVYAVIIVNLILRLK